MYCLIFKIVITNHGFFLCRAADGGFFNPDWLNLDIRLLFVFFCRCVQEYDNWFWFVLLYYHWIVSNQQWLGKGLVY